ncbi:MAG: hypothetical protein WBL39_02715 [Terrimicrobiaceae bacterium]
MDLEEQRLKHRIDLSEEALKEKVNIFKERIEDLKRMRDVKSKVEERPVLTFAGSVLAGFLARKWVGRKNQHSTDAYRANRRENHSSISASAAAGFRDPVAAIVTAIATRAVVGIVTELARKVMPHRHEAPRTDRSHSRH